jgi:hypothetical protein
MVAAFLGMLGIRFAFGSLFFRSVSMFLAALGFSVLALVIALWDRRAYPDGSGDTEG